MNAGYRQFYGEGELRAKLERLGGIAGGALAEQARTLHALLNGARTPAWAKAAILAALGYLICPLDAVPDPLPGVGLADDAALMAALLLKLSGLAVAEVRRRAGEPPPGRRP